MADEFTIPAGFDTSLTPENVPPVAAPVDPIKAFAEKQAAFSAPVGEVHNAPAGVIDPAAPALPGPKPPGPYKPAAAAAPSGPPQPPPEQPGHPLYDVTTSSSSGSSGLSAKDAAAQRARYGEASAARGEADDAVYRAKQARAEYEARATDEALSSEMQKARELAAEKAINDHITGEVDRKMQAASDWQPDRARIFSGSTGAARGILAAISVICGGWMQGRGQTATNQFLPLVYKMIDDDVQDQVRSNSANIQFLREQKGDLKAAGLELKKRMYQNVDAQLAAKVAATAAKDPSVQAALEAARKESAAAQAAMDAEQNKSLLRTTTEQVTRQSTPRAAGDGKPPSAAEMQASSQLRALDRTIADLEAGEESGDLKSVAGWQDKLGANSFQEYFGGLPPGQQRTLNAMRRLEMLNRSDWKSEPNGQAVQERLAGIGIARNDRDIPVMMQGLKAMRADMLKTLQGRPVGEQDTTRGAF